MSQNWGDPVDHRFRVLVADCNKESGAALGDALRAHGHEALVCCEPQTAWKALSAGDIDLAIVDLDADEADAFGLIHRCRGNPELAALPIISLSGSSDEYVVDRAFSVGTTLFLIKPVKMVQLTRNVWYALHNRARDQEMAWLKARLGIQTNRHLEVAY